MAEQEGELENVQEYQDTELLQQFQTEDGSTIVLSSEQLAQMQQGISEEHYVEEIIGADPAAEGGTEQMETQEIHVDAEGNTQIVSDGQIHDLVTFHAVGVGMDAQGNIIGGESDTVDAGIDGHVEIPMDTGGIDQIMEDGGVVEEVISSGQDEETFLEDNIGVGNDQFLHQVFNPETGTFSQVPTSLPQVTEEAKIKKPAPKQQVKYVLSQPGADGTSNQIVLDANSLQGLIQGGTLTLDGSGKSLVLSSSNTAKPKPTPSKSPAKILPAPHPTGDQQQLGAKKVVYMQGSSLAGSSGETKFITTGSGNQMQLLRVIPKSQLASNKVPIAPAPLKPKPVAPKPGSQTIILPGGAADIPSGSGLFVVPNFLVKNDGQSLRTGETITGMSSVLTDSNSLLSGLTSATSLDAFRSLMEPNGMRPRKPCNCTKSQCLKLYCDCFANGEFCHLCNCTNCFNNLTHEEDRQKAIKLVLERNPGAFRPKIGKSSMTGEAHERRHNKGCNCRRSGCLKNYCECYEAKIFCSGICKCTGCKNCIENIPSGLPNGVGVEQHFAGAGTAHRQTLKDLAEAAEVRVQQQNQVKNKMRAQMQEVSPQNNLGIMVPPIVFRYPSGSISYEVITSTVELLLAKAEAAEKQRLSEGEVERLILEEFSECLGSVMDLGTTIE